MAATDGGSGRWSMAENRNARPQSVKDDTFDGDRLVGSGNGMHPGYARGVTAPGIRTCQSDAAKGSNGRRQLGGGLEGAEVGEVLVDLEAALRGAPRRPPCRTWRGRTGSALQATTTGHWTSPRCS